MRVVAESLTPTPASPRLALNPLATDEAVLVIEGERAEPKLIRVDDEPFVADFSTFTEWATEADCEAYDALGAEAR